MRKYSRLLTMLLALVMLAGCCSGAYAMTEAGTAGEYTQYIEDYLNAQREAENQMGEPVLSEQVNVTRPFTNAAPLLPPVSTGSEYAVATMSLEPLADAGVIEDADGNNVVTSKTSTTNSDGSYTIRIDSFTTGEKTITEETTALPADIILVLDQSGSMDDSFTTYVEGGYKEYSKSETNASYMTTYTDSQNIWYELEDGTYVQVQIERTASDDYTYSAISKPGRWDYLQFTSYKITLYNHSLYEELYYKSGDSYIKVNVTRNGSNWLEYSYTYTLEDGTTLGSNIGFGEIPDQTFYLKEPGDYSYTYYYTTDTNNDGVLERHDIITSNGQATAPLANESYYFKKQEATTSSTTKLAALKEAVTTFADNVAEKATSADQYRIAVVGFASGSSWNGTNYRYGNTEVFVGSTQYNYQDVMGDNTDPAKYIPFQDMATSGGKSNISASIGALDANGGTLTNLGIELANDIFANDTPPAGDRQRVVIVFTDGQPGWSGYDATTANNAISQSSIAKNTYRATVYTVGIFDGADVNGTDNVNTFMHNLSSNQNRKDGYYLVASNANELSHIFKTISNKIESGSSGSTLDETAVLKDIVTPYFTLPANTSDITLKTADYDGKESDGTRKWINEKSATGVTATIDEATKSVSVSGFDFSGNYVADIIENGKVTGYQGKKLIIEFTVKPEAGFLGGNGVPTNGENSGIYSGGTVVERFEVPTVDVPVKPLVVNAAEKNVYLLDAPTEEELLVGATVKAVDMYGKEYDIDNLADWQKKYVVIEGPTATVVEGTTMPMVEDGQYRVSASINGGTDDSTKQTTTSAPAKINVFKPVLTFKDGVVPYMAKFPADDTLTLNDYVSADTVWKHGDTVADPTAMGAAPTINVITYSAASGVTNGDVTAVDLVPVEVESITVQNGGEVMLIYSTNASDAIGTSHVTFMRAACGHTGCSNSEVSTHLGNVDAPEFVLHVINVVGNLTITKRGLDVKTHAPVEGKYSDNESAIFTVSGDYDGDGKEDIFTVVIPCPGPEGSGSVTLTGLRVGVYTVTEQTGWTWRYGTSTITDSYVVDGVSTENDGVVKVEGNKTAQVECVNSGHTDKWLGGDNYATNVFGKSN